MSDVEDWSDQKIRNVCMLTEVSDRVVGANLEALEREGERPAGDILSSALANLRFPWLTALRLAHFETRTVIHSHGEATVTCNELIRHIRGEGSAKER